MKKIIVISGLPGSGKSTVAEEIAEKLHFPIFSVDPIESAIIKSGIKKSFETGLAAYVVTETLAAEQLRLDQSVIIDAVSPVKQARNMWKNLSKTYHANQIVIECILDSEMHKKRIASRIRNLHGIAEVTWEDVQRRRKEYLPWTEKRLLLDTSGKREDILQLALKYVSEFDDTP